MNTKTKRGLMVTIPIVIAAAIVYLVNRKRNKLPVEEGTTSDIKDVPPSTSTTSSSFPIKKGSRGEKVKELQRIVGAQPDGIFGDETENKLISFAGVRVVNNQKELDNLNRLAIGITNKARADELVSRFKKGGVSMYVIKNAPTEIVTVDAFGAIQYTGKSKVFAGGKTYSNKDYILTGSTKFGYLLFEINKGTLAGTYIVDPNYISLK